jgi:hypothetical protein
VLDFNGLTGNNAAFTTTGAAASRATADTSAYATGYDGILPTVLGPNSGYNNAINSTFSLLIQVQNSRLYLQPIRECKG